MPSYNRAMLLAFAMLFGTSACGANQTTVPAGGAYGAAVQRLGAGRDVAAPADTTSILKKLTKDVVIGSTVDPSNGDQGPHAVSIVSTTGGSLKAGQLLVCNFADSSGTAGDGTTIEALDPKVGSKPTRFVQSDDIKGCTGAAYTHSKDIYATGFTSQELVEFSDTGKILKIYKGKLFKGPFSVTFATAHGSLAPAFVYSTDATLGTTVSTQVGFYGDKKATQVISGFAVNKKSGWAALGPAGPQYDKSVDNLYLDDGVTNTVVEIEHASNLLVADEIIVQSSGKTFKCKFAKVTCGKLVKAGSPLNAPEAMTLLPNGNLIVANTGGTANTLVELTPTGQVLATKVVDTKSTQGVYALAASGTTDNNTVLYYTDTNDNNLHELEQ
jgi:hypothetical protein